MNCLHGWIPDSLPDMDLPDKAEARGIIAVAVIILIAMIYACGCSTQTVNVPPGCHTVYVSQWMNDPRTVSPSITMPTNAVEQAAKGAAEGLK